MLRFALHLRYTSAQAYRLLLEKFPLPSFSLLSKLQKGGVDAIKSIKLLRAKGEISKDVILMVDEMFLQKISQYQAGQYVGKDENGVLYKDIVAFMIAGLEKSIPYVIQATPEVTFTGDWLAKMILSNIKALGDVGFRVRAVVSDNHSTSVNAYSEIVHKYKSESPYYFNHPSFAQKYIFIFR